MPKCDRDCLNCKFDDCIVDESRALEYYYNHREEILLKKKTYYQQHAEQYKANAIKWQKENPERVKKTNKKACATYYQKNKDKLKAYYKEYYRRKKQGGNTDKPIPASN